MKYHWLCIICILCCCQCKSDQKETVVTDWEIQQQQYFPVKASVRALEVVDENTVWFAGSDGQYGYTKDGGKSWHFDQIKTDTIIPHFRSIAITRKATFLLSIASPALLYKTEDWGENWKIVFREDHPDVFFDAMAFWNDQEGIAMGDPIDGCLSVIITRDGGESWERVSCDKLPSTEEGEAAFAASNSNIAISVNHAWIVSGGKRARVFHSANRGKSWKVYNTPISEGGEMTGIYSVAFRDRKNGIIFGGDWNKKDQKTNNKARTIDGGRTWQLIADGADPGYRSHVRYVPGRETSTLIAVGIPGVSYSQDGGDSWKLLSDEAFYTVDFASENLFWMAGDKKLCRVELTDNQ